MPNYCFCRLIVEGAINDVEDILQTQMDFEKIRPCEDAEDWFHWRIQHWGTKWSAMNVKMTWKNTTGKCVIDFSTAWTPPVPLIHFMSTQYPRSDFKLYYDEPGMEFSGHVQYKNGELLSQEHQRYDDESE
jgi:hypothetical protein